MIDQTPPCPQPQQSRAEPNARSARCANAAQPEAPMPNLERVLETALYVDDLDRAARFYGDVLELRPLFADERLRAFAVGGLSVLLLFRRGASLETARMPGGTIPPHDGSGPLHVAFGIGREELAAW